PVSAETARVVREALRWAELSAGGFDPALAGAMALWHVHSRIRPPSAREVQRWAGRELYRSVAVDRFRGDDVVLFQEKDAGLDLGGIAKG
ncbi:MAG: FAD:protein FMN transferase, partial [Gemmatimonadetes bacterium]|nr:FAD:protein FMN transferase [Gemmatimonadota bacterium]NIS01027.1 FAD:protein FMN transferase [Gemmatimonadota bacterium]NIU51600.1 FAD:protein FMN transferase [Gemmatimonadota bacterium]